MSPPARGYTRLCSSALVPLVLLALLWHGADRGAIELQAARQKKKGVVPAIAIEHPDGVHLPILKPKPVTHSAWPDIPSEAADGVTVVRARLAPKPAPAPAPHIAWPGIARRELSDGTKRSVFSGLGAWVDIYDYPVLPLEQTIAVMKNAGVNTLYIETGMSGTRDAVVPQSVPWLVAAHNAGMEVVAWYLPYYVNVRSDVARTAWIARYSYQGIRFDGIGIDIEFKGAMPNNRVWNRNVVAHMAGVRRALGPNYPLAAIPPPPLQMRLAPATWDGFPWKQLGKLSSDIMLMSYWSFRSGCPKIALNCPYEFTKYNVEITRQITGGNVPIHVIGGVADAINVRQLNQFVQGALDAHADGASIYDVGTTKPGWWQYLSRLRALD